MALFDLFVNKKELCKTDSCINKTVDFIKIIHSYEGLDCPMFEVSFGDNSISFYFFDSDNSTPCIFKNMIHRGQGDEDAINLSIGKAIHAYELPEGTKIQWNFDSDKNEYDSYFLRHYIATEHKKSGSIYYEYVKNMCEELNLRFKENGNRLSFTLK